MSSFSILLVIFVILVGTSGYQFPRSLGLHSKHARGTSIVRERCAIFASEPSMDGPDLESLFEQIKDLDPEDVPQEMQDAIRDKIAENAPADWKIRLNLMGFNPLTIAGYMLAAVLITCNSVFGAGWAGDLLGMNEVVISDRTQVPQPRMGSNEKFSNSYDGIIRTEVQTFELNGRDNML